MTFAHKGGLRWLMLNSNTWCWSEAATGSCFFTYACPAGKKSGSWSTIRTIRISSKPTRTAMRGEQWRPPASQVSATATPLQKALPGTFRALCEDYLVFLARDPRVSKRTKYTRRQHLEHVCREPTKPGAPYVMGDVPMKKFGPTHVIAVRDRKLNTPEAANNRHKALSAMFGWALERRYVDSNPALQVRRIKTRSEGFKTWTRDDMDRFAERHPLG